MLIKDEKDEEITRLRALIRKRDVRIKKLKGDEKYRSMCDVLNVKQAQIRQLNLRIYDLKRKLRTQDERYAQLEKVYKKLHDKFEVNFLLRKQGESTCRT